MIEVTETIVDCSKCVKASGNACRPLTKGVSKLIFVTKCRKFCADIQNLGSQQSFGLNKCFT